MKNEIKDGSVIKYYENGNIHYKSILKDGKQNGVYYEYFENGNLKYGIRYRNDLKNGVYNEYRENGILYRRGEFVDNELIGEFKNYDNLGFELSPTRMVSKRPKQPFEIEMETFLKNKYQTEYEKDILNLEIESLKYRKDSFIPPVTYNLQPLSVIEAEKRLFKKQDKIEEKLKKNDFQIFVHTVHEEWKELLKGNLKPKKFDYNEYRTRKNILSNIERKYKDILYRELDIISSKVINKMTIQGRRTNYSKEEIKCDEKYRWFNDWILLIKQEIKKDFDNFLNEEVKENEDSAELLYYTILENHYWNKDINDWENPNNDLTLDLLIWKYPESKLLKTYLQRENNNVRNFEEFWNKFPISDLHGNWMRTMSFGSKKEETEILYNKLIDKGVKHKYIILTLESEVDRRIKTSYTSNKLSYLKNTYNFLYQFEVNYNSLIEEDLKRLLLLF